MNKNKILLIGGLSISAIIALFSIKLTLADATENILPSSDGVYLQWAPKTGTAHYAMVDELTCNGTADYNYTNTIGSRDSYGINLASVPDGSTITAIEITPCASQNKNGGGSGIMNIFYRYNGADSADAGNYTLSGTTPTQLGATNFNGLSLIKESASSLEIGAVLSSGRKGARLSRLAAVITYTIPLNPPAAPSNLTAAASSTNAILNWIDNSGNEDGFRVERSIDSFNFSQIATTGINIANYIDWGLATGTYFYRAKAFNSDGDSGYSNTASTTIW